VRSWGLDVERDLEVEDVGGGEGGVGWYGYPGH